MDNYLVSLVIIGIASLAMAWMPALGEKTRIPYSLIYVLAGVLLFSFIPSLPRPDPLNYKSLTLHLTELVVIVSLMGTGLKIDEPFSFNLWNAPIRLATLTMFLCITAVALIGWYFLHLDVGTAVLLGAVLAPTDPVLASDVQVGPPLKNDRHNVRFSLTAEAGLNDGMAFPFTWLALSIAMTGELIDNLSNWFIYYLLYKIVAGVVVGYILGKLIAYLVIYLPENKNFIVIKDGFVGVAATLLVYGITELLKGYGFIAVFVTAIAIRNSEMQHRYHKKVHNFTDQVERLLLAIILILFGGALVNGILAPITWPWIIFSIVFILFIRPFLSYITLAGLPLHIKEKLAISFYGIRGMGSFFYLAFAFSIVEFLQAELLYAVISLIVLLSLVIHGFSANAVMSSLSDKYPHLQEKLDKEKSLIK